MYPTYIILILYPILFITLPIKYKDNKPLNRIVELGKSPAEFIPYTESAVLYQPMALFPIQLLPYQYYQIVQGKFLLPSSTFLYNFFLPEYPFAESQYKEVEYKEKLFEEKGEYSL